MAAKKRAAGVRVNAASLVQWLGSRASEADRNAKAYAKRKRYGEAQYCAGLAAAYAFATLHVQRVAEGVDGE